MGAIIRYENQVIYASNGEWEAAMRDALAVACMKELSETEREYVERFQLELSTLFSGYCPRLERLFPSKEEKLFWRQAWIVAAQKIVAGELPGNPNMDPARRVFICYWCGYMLGYLALLCDVDASRVSMSLTEQDAAMCEGEKKSHGAGMGATHSRCRQESNVSSFRMGLTETIQRLTND